MTEPITSFSGEFSFLSNFHHSSVNFEEIRFPTAEHAYQAAKTLNHQERYRISMLMTPGKAKRAGQQLHLRPDWERVKLHVMKKILRMKFSNPELREKLLATAPRELVEGNSWGDKFWGRVLIPLDVPWQDSPEWVWEGENNLGIILMEIRHELA